MNEKTDSVVVEHADERLSLGKYIAGFVGSVAVTLAAYLLTTHQAYGKNMVVGVLAGLAVLQFIIQMVLFLHAGSERKPRWKLAVMVLMLITVLILVGGSIWIMHNLNYRMDQTKVQRYLHDQDSL